MGLTLAVVSLVLSVISIALLAYDVGGFRDGYEIGKAERPEAGLSAKEHEKGA